MSRSYFSKAYEEMTFTIEDADLDKLNEILKDINVKECPWFEVQDKHGNKAKYYREPHWIPCTERLPEDWVPVLVTLKKPERLPAWIKARAENYFHFVDADVCENGEWTVNKKNVIAWQPLPSPYTEEADE